MPSRIPHSGVPLVDALKGFISREWFRFLSGLSQLVPSTVLTATATLDFPNTAANAVSDLTVTVTGALTGDVVNLGLPVASVPAAGLYTAWVSASNTVTVRFVNNTAAAINPASGSFLVVVTRY